ncbi:hypothetical protein GVN18_19705 [Pseudomonas sp. ODNR1LW]|nr:hypothetical protein [Pseudomonas sp. ODNR1LW]
MSRTIPEIPYDIIAVGAVIAGKISLLQHKSLKNAAAPAPTENAKSWCKFASRIWSDFTPQPEKMPEPRDKDSI